jgi:hypothetical protein
MKKILYTLSCLLFLSFSVIAQDEDDRGGKLREKMTEYIQTRLGLSKAEADKFNPVFLEYFKELRRTNKEFRGDKLVLQQKIVELRLRYRDQFRPIIGEKRSNDVFIYERDFIDEVQKVRKERLENRLEARANQKKDGSL